mmetsp:Transcript_9306/g.19259  ORF Transcript_9306/g.19259 Transcript_9306/m.19259 type:complete len:178 (+) Transcript_9306:1506-2039(+)
MARDTVLPFQLLVPVGMPSQLQPVCHMLEESPAEMLMHPTQLAGKMVVGVAVGLPYDEVFFRLLPFRLPFYLARRLVQELSSDAHHSCRMVRTASVEGSLAKDSHLCRHWQRWPQLLRRQKSLLGQPSQQRTRHPFWPWTKPRNDLPPKAKVLPKLLQLLVCCLESATSSWAKQELT